MSSKCPKLRPLETFLHREDDRDFVCLRDPAGFIDKVMAVSLSALPLLKLLDGEHSIAQIQATLTKKNGDPVSRETIEKFVEQLDNALLLDSPRFRKHWRQRLDQYRQQPVRPAACAGTSYPAQPSSIHAAFNDHFRPPSGPGTDAALSNGQPPAALVIPHIDLRHGGPTYAWAYNEIRRASPQFDTFIILGVAHAPTAHRFVGTRKDFQTPLGVVHVDQPMLDAIAAKMPVDIFADELVHAQEHSIEFQVVYLQHILGPQTPFRIVPILVSSFHDLMESQAEPANDPQVGAFIDALATAANTPGKRVCVIASIDLAHVGHRFGDEFTVNREVLQQLETDDRAMLAHVEALKPRELWRFICAEQDRRRVDGYPALYTMLHSLDLHQAKLLRYNQNVETDTNSVVSFASMSFYRNHS